MKTLVLIAIAFISSLFATPPAPQESPECIAVSKDQIILIEDGLFVAHDGSLFPGSALFHTDTGFIAEIRGRERDAPPNFERCPRCNGFKYTGVCMNVGCPLYGQ